MRFILRRNDKNTKVIKAKNRLVIKRDGFLNIKMVWLIAYLLCNGKYYISILKIKI